MVEAKHEHRWIATQAAALDAGYPSFVVRYGCYIEGAPDCHEELIEVIEGVEL